MDWAKTTARQDEKHLSFRNLVHLILEVGQYPGYFRVSHWKSMWLLEICQGNLTTSPQQDQRLLEEAEGISFTITIHFFDLCLHKKKSAPFLGWEVIFFVKISALCYEFLLKLLMGAFMVYSLMLHAICYASRMQQCWSCSFLMLCAHTRSCEIWIRIQKIL